MIKEHIRAFIEKLKPNTYISTIDGTLSTTEQLIEAVDVYDYDFTPLNKNGVEDLAHPVHLKASKRIVHNQSEAGPHNHYKP